MITTVTIGTYQLKSIKKDDNNDLVAKPSHAAAGGSQISLAEISFIITAQPPSHPTSHILERALFLKVVLVVRQGDDQHQNLAFNSGPKFTNVLNTGA